MNAQEQMPPAANATAVQAALAQDGGARLFTSFGIASMVVLIGVLGAWVLVKRAGSGDEMVAGDMALEQLPMTVLARSADGVATLLDQADVAFAAGRIVEPRFDNAMYFYRAVLEQAPADSAARAGMKRVVQWLVGQMNLAMDGGDFASAEALAGRIVDLRPEDADAIDRFARVSAVRELTALASEQRARGDVSATALTYGRLLALDPENRLARDGLLSAVAALVDAGTLAATEGRIDDARSFLAEARRADAGAAGVAALTRRLESMARATAAEARDEALLAIRGAIREAAVLGDSGVDAFEMIASFERTWPEAETVAALGDDARLALVEVGRRALSGQDFPRAERAIARATELGVDAGVLAGMRDELAWRTYLAAFARGDWELRAISDLTVLAQVAPEFPARASRTDGGWVDLEFTVAADGSVEDPKVLDASSRLFVNSSLEAIAAWRFEPTRVAGRAVPTRAVLRFSFRNV